MEAKAVYDFEKTNADELSFKQNEMLLIMDSQTDENWWSAAHYESPSEGKGLVPMNYVKMLSNEWYEGRISRKRAEEILLAPGLADGAFLLRDSESSPGDFSLSIKFQNGVQHFKVLRDGTGKFFLWVVKFPSINKLIDYHKKASVSRTQTIILKDGAAAQQSTNDGNASAHKGSSQEKPAKKRVETVQCMYDFTPEDDEELPFTKGQMLEVIEKDIDNAWWRGKNLTTGSTGLFPINYVKQLQK